MDRNQFLRAVLAAQPAAAHKLRQQATLKKPSTPSLKAPGKAPGKKKKAQDIQDGIEAVRGLLQEARAHKISQGASQEQRAELRLPATQGSAPVSKYSLQELEDEARSAMKDGDKDRELWFRDRLTEARKARPRASPGELIGVKGTPPGLLQQSLLGRLPAWAVDGLREQLPRQDCEQLNKTWDFVKAMNEEAIAGFLEELQRQVRDRLQKR